MDGWMLLLLPVASLCLCIVQMTYCVLGPCRTYHTPAVVLQPSQQRCLLLCSLTRGSVLFIDDGHQAHMLCIGLSQQVMLGHASACCIYSPNLHDLLQPAVLVFIPNREA